MEIDARRPRYDQDDPRVAARQRQCDGRGIEPAVPQGVAVGVEGDHLERARIRRVHVARVRVHRHRPGVDETADVELLRPGVGYLHEPRGVGIGEPEGGRRSLGGHVIRLAEIIHDGLHVPVLRKKHENALGAVEDPAASESHGLLGGRFAPAEDQSYYGYRDRGAGVNSQKGNPAVSLPRCPGRDPRRWLPVPVPLPPRPPGRLPRPPAPRSPHPRRPSPGRRR